MKPNLYICENKTSFKDKLPFGDKYVNETENSIRGPTN